MLVDICDNCYAKLSLTSFYLSLDQFLGCKRSTYTWVNTVGHDGGDDAGAVTLVLELNSDLVGTAPQLGTQLHGLGKVLDVDWHAGLLGMSEVMAVAMHQTN